MSISQQEIKGEFLKSKMGIAGITILIILITVSLSAIFTIPSETFSGWNNPTNWISYPKVAIPGWVNLFLVEKIPEHKIIDEPIRKIESSGNISAISHQFGFNFEYDDFPNDFIYEFSAEYIGSPLLEIMVIRPDGIQLELLSTSLPNSNSIATHTERIFSAEELIKKKRYLQSNDFEFSLDNLSSEDIVFSKTESHQPLKGNYLYVVNLYGIDSNNKIPIKKQRIFFHLSSPD